MTQSRGEVAKILKRWSGSVSDQGWRTSLLRHCLSNGMMRAQANECVVDMAPEGDHLEAEAAPTETLEPVIEPNEPEDPFAG